MWLTLISGQDLLFYVAHSSLNHKKYQYRFSFVDEFVMVKRHCQDKPASVLVNIFHPITCEINQVLAFMKGKFIVLLAVLLTVSVSSAMARQPFWGSVKKVIDGDSLLIVSGKKTIEIRLYGVDSPEYNQPFAGKAKALVKNSVRNKKILVRPVYYDSYQRLVAIIEYDNLTLNSELVGAGLAWVYPQYCRKKVCRSWQQREDSARAKKKGLWRTARPIPPWQWRERRGH